MEKMLRNKIVICSFLLPALLLFTVTVILPIGWSVYYSFFNWNGVSKMKFIGIDNYIRMFADNNFKTAFLNNILFLVANVLGQVGTRPAACPDANSYRQGPESAENVLFCADHSFGSSLITVLHKILQL